MLYAFFLLDRPDAQALRAQVRPEHREYLGRMADRMAFAGPLVADDGHTMIGSLLVIDFPCRAEASAWLASEPFTRAGLYASITIQPYLNLWPQKTGFAPQ